MNKTEIQQALDPLLEIFNSLSIPYRIGGSVASSAYGVARATLDIDLVADLHEDQVLLLVAGLRDAYYVDEDRIRDAILRQSSFNIIHLQTMFKLDVFVLKGRPYDQVAFSRARRENLGDEDLSREYYFSSPEDVILNKLDWYRQGGCVSDRQWNDIMGVLKVQGSALDMEYLFRWAEQLTLSDLLQRSLRDSGLVL
jgi:hypothetical protein